MEQRAGFHRIFWTWLISLVLAASSSCGYQFTGQSSFLPADVKSLYIEPFINRSRDIGVEKELASALRSEFYRKGQLKIVDEIEQADAIMTGVVALMESHLSTVNRRDEVLQYEATMLVDVTIRRRDPDVVIWDGRRLRFTRVYAGSRAAVVTTSSEFKSATAWSTADVARLTDIQLTEAAERQARDQLIAGFAEDIRQRLMEMF